MKFDNKRNLIYAAAVIAAAVIVAWFFWPNPAMAESPDRGFGYCTGDTPKFMCSPYKREHCLLGSSRPDGTNGQEYRGGYCDLGHDARDDHGKRPHRPDPPECTSNCEPPDDDDDDDDDCKGSKCGGDDDPPPPPPDDDDDDDECKGKSCDDHDNNGNGNGDEGDCQGAGCTDPDNPGNGKP